MKYHIFDLDGTLADSMPLWAGKMLRILNEAHTSYPDDIIKIITPLGDRGTAEYFIEALHINMTMEQMLRLMRDYAWDDYHYRIPLKDGVKEYLKQLKDEKDVYLGVLTASGHEYTDPCLKRNGVFDLFDTVWSITDFEPLKKDMPEIYTEAAKRMNASSYGDIVFYDDNLTALKTAKSAGLTTVGIFDETSKDYVTEIQAAVDKYAFSFRDLLK